MKKGLTATVPLLAMALNCGGAPSKPKIPLLESTIQPSNLVCDSQIRVLTNIAATLAWEKALAGLTIRHHDPQWETATEKCFKRGDQKLVSNLSKTNQKVADLVKAADVSKCKNLDGSNQDICLAKALTESACSNEVVHAVEALIRAEEDLLLCVSQEVGELSVCEYSKTVKGLKLDLVSDATDMIGIDYDNIGVYEEGDKFSNFVQKWASQTPAPIFRDDLLGCMPVNIGPSSLQDWHPLKCVPIDQEGGEKPVAVYDFAQCYKDRPMEQTLSESITIDLTVGILEFDKVLIRMETNEALQSPPKGLVFINQCISQAAQELNSKEREIFYTGKARAKGDYLFWLDQELIEEVGEKGMSKFAEKYRTCLKNNN